MKVRIFRKKSDESLGGFNYEVVECGHFSLQTSPGHITFYDDGNYPTRAISLESVIEWHVVQEFEFDTKTEKYLSENDGDLQFFYEGISNTNVFNYGTTFYAALSMKDQVRLTLAGRVDFGDEKVIDGPRVLSAISFLEETEGAYPVTHPINKVRFSKE